MEPPLEIRVEKIKMQKVRKIKNIGEVILLVDYIYIIVNSGRGPILSQVPHAKLYK